MRKLLIIGIGPGHPEQLTAQAIAALNQVDVFFVLDKSENKRDLAQFRLEVCERYARAKPYRVVHAEDPVRDGSVESYAARVEAWHTERSAIYARLFARELAENQCGGILVWGDPALYDSTLRIVEQVAAHDEVAFEYSVIPGVTAIQALTSSHRIALNSIGGSVVITTGRRLAHDGFPAGTDNVVVMLDGELAFTRLVGEAIDIYWGAYLGSDRELLVAGALTAERARDIAAQRSAARERYGWIMDTYLLRRRALAAP